MTPKAADTASNWISQKSDFSEKYNRTQTQNQVTNHEKLTCIIGSTQE